MIVIYLSVGLLIFIVGIVVGLLSAPRADDMSGILREARKELERRNIRYSMLKGEFQGTLTGILWWKLPSTVEKIVRDKLKELDEKDKY